MPLADIQKSVNADQQEQSIHFLEFFFQSPDGIDGVVRRWLPIVVLLIALSLIPLFAEINLRQALPAAKG